MPTTCCPPGFVYIDYESIYSDPSPMIGTGVITNTNKDEVNEKCVKLVNIVLSTPVGSAYALSPQEPIECTKCCPTNYTFSSYSGLCESGSPLPAVKPVPCVTCVCNTTNAFTCPTCGTSGTGIVFSFDSNKRQCTSCTPQDENVPTGNIASFVAISFLDPITSNFKLRNKNFI